jgi:hypothetical protein
MAFIKITTECFSSGVRLNAGLFYELPDAEARTLVQMDRAEFATAEEVQASAEEAMREAEAEAAAEAKAAAEAEPKAAKK